MQNNRSWIGIAALVVLLAIVAWGAVQVLAVVRGSLQASLGPVQDLADSVSTQVAEILHPTPTIIPDPVTIIHNIRSLARLETIQYSMEKVIVAESRQGPLGFLFGDRLLFIAHGSVIAGVDLEKLLPDDLWTQDGILYVRLPEAEVFVAILDNDLSYTYDRQVGVLTRGNLELETEARRAAEQEILNAALEDDILAQAQINAENFLYRLFLDLGYPEIIFLGAQTGE